MRLIGEWAEPGWLLRLAIAEPADAARLGRLSVGEQERAARFARAGDRAAYVAAHLLVRGCATRLVGGDEAALGEWRQECATCAGTRGRLHGRPAFAGRPALGVSLAHSDSWVAAVAGPPGVGVDLEAFGRRGSIPARLLPANETRWLTDRALPHDASLSGSGPERDLLRLWCRKEALFKAGIEQQVPAIPVLDADGPVRRLGDHRLVEPGWRDGVLVAALPVGSRGGAE